MRPVWRCLCLRFCSCLCSLLVRILNACVSFSCAAEESTAEGTASGVLSILFPLTHSLSLSLRTLSLELSRTLSRTLSLSRAPAPPHAAERFLPDVSLSSHFSFGYTSAGTNEAAVQTWLESLPYVQSKRVHAKYFEDVDVETLVRLTKDELVGDFEVPARTVRRFLKDITTQWASSGA